MVLSETEVLAVAALVPEPVSDAEAEAVAAQLALAVPDSAAVADAAREGDAAADDETDAATAATDGDGLWLVVGVRAGAADAVGVGAPLAAGEAVADETTAPGEGVVEMDAFAAAEAAGVLEGDVEAAIATDGDGVGAGVPEEFAAATVGVLDPLAANAEAVGEAEDVKEALLATVTVLVGVCVRGDGEMLRVAVEVVPLLRVAFGEAAVGEGVSAAAPLGDALAVAVALSLADCDRTGSTRRSRRRPRARPPGQRGAIALKGREDLLVNTLPSPQVTQTLPLLLHSPSISLI